MGQMILRWEKSRIRSNGIANNPIARFIYTKKRAGMSKQHIIESLIKQGYKFRDIKRAYLRVNRSTKKELDWRTITSINATSRKIRNDIRKGRISYPLGMTILIRARDYLRTVIKNPRIDKRLAQINEEVKITKRLLRSQFANKDSILHYRTVKRRITA